MTDPRHLLLVGTGPGLGAAIARRFARERYRLTLVARSETTIATIAQELRVAGPTSPSSRPTPAIPSACARHCHRCSPLRAPRAS